MRTLEMRVYAQKCRKIEVEIEIEGNRAFGPNVGWLSVMRTGGGLEKLGMRNEEWWWRRTDWEAPPYETRRRLRRKCPP